MWWVFHSRNFEIFHPSGKRAHYSIDGRCNCFDQARPVEPAHLPSTLSAFLLLPTLSVAHAARRGIDRLRLYGISCLFSRALRARGSLCKGIKKNFRRRPAKTPLPLISDCPGGVVLPLPRQHSALLLFLMPGIAQTRLMCFSALALLVQVRQRRFSPCSNGRQDHGFFSGTAKARTKTAYYNVVGIQ